MSARHTRAPRPLWMQTGRSGVELLGAQLSGWERVWEREPREHAVLEAGHCADLFAGEGEDEQPGAVPGAVGSAEVGAERRLTVGPRWDEVESPTRAKDACAEAGDDIPAL